MSAPDWNPDSYARFRGLRLRPAMDLLMQVPGLPADGPVVDLGCGDGAAAGALRQRFPGRALHGIDMSPAMLDRAAGYDIRTETDIATWKPTEPAALIFSNAALHWLPDHAALMPRLARFLAPGGTLAVQMPRQQFAPSHALMRQIAARLFPDRFDYSGWQPQVAAPADYAGWLGGLGTLSIWETEYFQTLPAQSDGHPVRHFTGSTAMRPIVEKLSPPETARFVAAYDAALFDAYPLLADGGAHFPFRRLFLTLTLPS